MWYSILLVGVERCKPGKGYAPWTYVLLTGKRMGLKDSINRAIAQGSAWIAAAAGMRGEEFWTSSTLS